MSSSAICLKQGALFEAALPLGRLRFPSLVASDANVVKRWSTAAILLFICACNGSGNGDLTAVPVSSETRHLLIQMNKLAEPPIKNRSFRYGLHANCTLAVEPLLSGNPTDRYSIPLASTKLEPFRYAGGLGYALRAPIGRRDAIMPIFEASQRAELEKMESLLKSLAASCSK